MCLGSSFGDLPAALLSVSDSSPPSASSSAFRSGIECWTIASPMPAPLRCEPTVPAYSLSL
ncbi:hypothetical protein AN220_25495 [Streptomyces nanshensis]|nr:hypothetical protein AN220_25495 [Streptomyces nanshensis]